MSSTLYINSAKHDMYYEIIVIIVESILHKKIGEVRSSLIMCAFFFMLSTRFSYIVKSQFISQSIHTQKDVCSLTRAAHNTTHEIHSQDVIKKSSTYCDLEDITVHR